MKTTSLVAVAMSALMAATLTEGTAHADVPVGPARLVPCPADTGKSANYPGAKAPYVCHSAVQDPLGNIVILRQGRSNGSGPGAFGWLHALQDHNVEDHTIEKVVSSATGISAPNRRKRYIAEFRSNNHPVMSVWVEVDPSPSNSAPDSEGFGVVTAYCKIPSRADPERLCPDWVNETI